MRSHDGATNSLTEIYADKNSFIDYYKIQNDIETSNLIDNTFIDQQRDSNVRVHTFSFGGKLTRNNLNFYHKLSLTISFPILLPQILVIIISILDMLAM